MRRPTSFPFPDSSFPGQFTHCPASVAAVRADPGPFGLLLMVIGMLIAGSVAMSASQTGEWMASLPSLLIGLSLVAVGYSLFSRARRARRRHTPD